MEKYYYIVCLVISVGSAVAAIAGSYYFMKYKVADLSAQFGKMQADNALQSHTLTKVESDVRNIDTRMNHWEREAAESRTERLEMIKGLTEVRMGVLAIRIKMGLDDPMKDGR